MKYIIFILGLFLFACSSGDNSNTAGEDAEISPEQMQNDVTFRPFKKYYEKGDASFYVDAQNSQVTPIRIRTTGLANNYDYKFKVKGRVIGGFMLDLNKDNYGELYLAIQGNGKQQKRSVVGFASVQDDHIVRIEIPDFDEKRDALTDRIFSQEGGFYRTHKTTEGEDVYFEYVLSGTGDDLKLTYKDYKG